MDFFPMVTSLLVEVNYKFINGALPLVLVESVY